MYQCTELERRGRMTGSTLDVKVQRWKKIIRPTQNNRDYRLVGNEYMSIRSKEQIYNKGVTDKC